MNAKEAEIQLMHEHCKDKKLDTIYSTWEMTPSEHFFMGSTWPGKAFHPNYPLSLLLGRTLDESNNIRQNLQTELACEHNGQCIFAEIQLLPIKNSQLENEEVTITFQFTGKNKDLSGNQLDNISDDQILKNLKAKLLIKQQEEREQLNKEVSNGQ